MVPYSEKIEMYLYIVGKLDQDYLTQKQYHGTIIYPLNSITDKTVIATIVKIKQHSHW